MLCVNNSSRYEGEVPINELEELARLFVYFKVGDFATKDGIPAAVALALLPTMSQEVTGAQTLLVRAYNAARGSVWSCRMCPSTS
jgi:hypothetical protein